MEWGGGCLKTSAIIKQQCDQIDIVYFLLGSLKNKPPSFLSVLFLSKMHSQAMEMTQQTKVHAAKPANLNWSPRPHKVEEEL